EKPATVSPSHPEPAPSEKPATVSPGHPEPALSEKVPGRTTVIPLSQVPPVALQWLWHPWIPSGKVTVLDGDPGLGKSSLLLDLAARVTRGLAMPDGGPVALPSPPAGIRAAGDVTLLTAEDSLADTVRPRLEAAGADL